MAGVRRLTDVIIMQYYNTKEHRNSRHRGTEEQRNRGTEEQRNRGTEEQ